MLKTRMTELFEIRYPIMLAGMNWITDEKLVANVSNAGGLGVFATARCTIDEMRESIRHIKKLTNNPFGTEIVDPARIEKAITAVFDLRPGAIIRDLDLLRPIYAQTAAYGHFGRNDPDFAWEKTNKADALKSAARKSYPVAGASNGIDPATARE